jgi:hypothetical protein
MQVSKTVIAAITGAIGMYLEASLHLALPVAEETWAQRIPGPAFSLWAVAGRQSTMDMRRFLQMRLAR